MDILIRCLIALAVVVVLSAIYILVYYLNKKTPVPEGCAVIDCHGCQETGCARHPGREV